MSAIYHQATDLVVEDWSRKGPDDHIPVCEDTFVFSVRSALFAILGEDFHDDALVYKFKKAYETVGSLNVLLVLQILLYTCVWLYIYVYIYIYIIYYDPKLVVDEDVKKPNK